MPRQKFYDVPGGDTIVYDIVDESNGYRQSTFMFSEDERYEYFRNIRHITCKDDDIFFNSYPKTGSNWLWEMMKLMVNKSSQVCEETKGVGMLEARPLTVLDDMPSPRILNTHLKVQYTPKEAVDRRVKTIILCRNPKDVVVSFYNHTRGLKTYDYQGKFENFLQMFIRGDVDYGSYPEYLMEWQQHIRDNPDVPVHIIYYENLKEECFSELRKLRDFLGLKVTDDLLVEIADSCSMAKMRETKPKQMKSSIVAHFKKMTNPGYSVMRKGQIGDWKNWFTVAQSEMFDEWWDKAASGLDMFKFRYIVNRFTKFSP